MYFASCGQGTQPLTMKKGSGRARDAQVLRQKKGQFGHQHYSQAAWATTVKTVDLVRAKQGPKVGSLATVVQLGNCGNQADRKESSLKRQTWARVRNWLGENPSMGGQE